MESGFETRYPLKTAATLRVLSDAGPGVDHAVILDMLKTGTRVECAQYIRHNSQVSIETEDLTVVGRVQNCTEIRAGLYRFGIKICDVT